VMPVKGLKKRRSGRKSTAGWCGEPKELNRGNHGSRRKLAATCRKVSRYATVAWRKKNLIRQIRTEVNWGTRSTVTVAGRRMTRYTGVAWLRGGIMRKNCTRIEDAWATQRLGPLRKNLWTTHKGKCEINYMCDKRQLDVRKKRETTIGVEGWSSRQLSPMAGVGNLRLASHLRLFGCEAAAL
jgi:hypothetical protein